MLLADALGEALGDPDPAVGRAASDALLAIARGGADVSGVLRAGLRSPVPLRRIGAALLRGRLEPPDLALLPALVEGLDREEDALRWSSARVLVAAGHAHGEVRLLLLGLLRDDPRPRLRRMAVHSLRELAPTDPETVLALRRAGSDPDPGVREAARQSLAGRSPGPPRAQKSSASSE